VLTSLQPTRTPGSWPICLTRQPWIVQAFAWVGQVLKVVRHTDLGTLPAVCCWLLELAVEHGTVGWLRHQPDSSEPDECSTTPCTVQHASQSITQSIPPV
jgi:hypothetical protein